METQLEWDQLVDSLRDELQEKGGLIRLLNQQTELLYQRDPRGNERVEEQIRGQLRLVSRCTQSRELILRETATRLNLREEADATEIVHGFPEYVQPLLEALFTEVERLSGRM
ncbi:MAG TPA: hypothetical protein VN857_05745, partial [Chthoniobacterales bacterium]|nr:hypothetical protein [Chthoniobacterales bacterium]